MDDTIPNKLDLTKTLAQLNKSLIAISNNPIETARLTTDLYTALSALIALELRDGYAKDKDFFDQFKN